MTVETSPEGKGTEMRFFSDYGKYGQISIMLPPFVGDESEFDAEFDEIMSFMTTIMKRRKAAFRARAHTTKETDDV